jgi:hypothetical protein
MTVTKKVHLFPMPHNPNRRIWRHYGKTQVCRVFWTHSKGHKTHGKGHMAEFCTAKNLCGALFVPRTAKSL